jgi:hypothetical protein
MYVTEQQHAEEIKELETLQVNYNALKNRYQSVKGENTRLNETVQDVDLEVRQTMDKLEDFETTIRDSMQWFRFNSNLKNKLIYSDMQQQLKERCLETTTETCGIKLDCIHEVNNDNSITYKADDNTVKRVDFLLDLRDIYGYKGGDCEDISLLFTAEYNFLADECSSQGFARDKIKVSLKGAEEKRIYLDGTYMYVVCGEFNPQEMVQDYAGHCLVGLTDEPIKDSKDVYARLRDADLVEPQTGQYVLNVDDTEVIEIFSDNKAPTTRYNINMVITNDDLKVFYTWGEDVRWMGYAEFLEEIEATKSSLGAK